MSTPDLRVYPNGRPPRVYGKVSMQGRTQSLVPSPNDAGLVAASPPRPQIGKFRRVALLIPLKLERSPREPHRHKPTDDEVQHCGYRKHYHGNHKRLTCRRLIFRLVSHCGDTFSELCDRAPLRRWPANRLSRTPVWGRLEWTPASRPRTAKRPAAGEHLTTARTAHLERLYDALRKLSNYSPHMTRTAHAPAGPAAGVARASRMAVRALRPLRRPVSTMEQRAA